VKGPSKKLSEKKKKAKAAPLIVGEKPRKTKFGEREKVPENWVISDPSEKGTRRLPPGGRS